MLPRSKKGVPCNIFQKNISYATKIKRQVMCNIFATSLNVIRELSKVLENKKCKHGEDNDD